MRRRPTIGFIEVPARDPRRASEFFAEVFGWSSRERLWSGGMHVQLDGGTDAVGCALVRAEGLGNDAPTPVVHVDAQDLDDLVGRVEGAGGRVAAAPRRIDDLGRFALIADPDGNVWGLWAASSRQP